MQNNTNTSQFNQIESCVATDSRNELLSFLEVESSSLEKALKSIHNQALYFSTEDIDDQIKNDLFVVNNLRDKIKSLRKEAING